jgi:hypothetical protein
VTRPALAGLAEDGRQLLPFIMHYWKVFHHTSQVRFYSNGQANSEVQNIVKDPDQIMDKDSQSVVVVLPGGRNIIVLARNFIE